MISCKTYPEAEKIAMAISKKELRSISIVQRCNYGKPSKTAYDGQDFIVCDNYKNGIEDRMSHDKFVMLISNYETPFEISSVSPKSGLHIECFPTKEQANVRYKEIIKDNYRRQISKNYN